MTLIVTKNTTKASTGILIARSSVKLNKGILMLRRDVIVIGTSAGGLEALKNLIGRIPAGFGAAILIVWHMPPDAPGILPQILSRISKLPVLSAQDGQTIEAGHVYVATPDHHLMVEHLMVDHPMVDSGKIRVTHGPKENFFRPSVDVLFRSAAGAFGPRVIGVVLTGMLDDGASGLYAVKKCGGLAVVQDPVDAPYPEMPINAMKAVNVDYSVPLRDMGKLLVRLTAESQIQRQSEAPCQSEARQGEHAVNQKMNAEVRVALGDQTLETVAQSLGEPSRYSCPECHGVLTRIEEGPLLRFRCHVGHAFSFQALLSGIAGSVEDSLWSALRALEEGEMLMSHMAQHLETAGEREAAGAFHRKAREARRRAETVRQMVSSTHIEYSQER
jgi:two-component system, chemotaxis family, protein-glutamate methylesterase/glutaminase